MRKAVDRLYGHRVMRRRAPEVTSEAALRGARASAALDGADWPLEEVRRRSDFSADPEARTVGGALRISAEAGQLLSVWRHSPLQVLARLHLLAVGDADESAGRPRLPGEGAAALFPLELKAADTLPHDPGHEAHADGAAHHHGPADGETTQGDDGPTGLPELPPAPSAEEATARLEQLAQLLAARTEGSSGGTPALVVSAVVHGELLALRPFGSHNGMIARAAQRIVLVAEGLDPKAICPAEVGFVELGTVAYRRALQGYLSGTAEGMAAWIVHCGEALRLGVRESTAVCEAMQRGMV
ncbi:oxidoreductase [Kitasatospora kazusensis]|uniref:Oxidoreductase n=1 Tax=Kitasatospora kazusensis TaxID=407974 RepID=A0ABP5KWF4_9ACTN